MQQKSKHTFVKSKMNKDLDARLLEAGEYRDGVNISVSRSEGDDVGALENILGNEIISNLTYDITNNNSPLEIIGWHIAENQDNIYLFLTNYQDNSSDEISNPAGYSTLHRILQFNVKTNTTTTLVEGYFLNFSMNSPILHTNLVEDLLFWTDNRNQPRKINVTTAFADPNYYTNEDHISVAKYYPWDPIKVVKETVATGVVLDKSSTNSPGPGIGTWPSGYNAWRNYMVLRDDTPQETLDFLAGAVGAKGYVIDNNGDRWEFTVAWFQYDDNGGGGGITPSLGPDYNNAHSPLVFIERDMRAPNFTLSIFPFLEEYEFHFYKPTAKDISSQWLEESKSKLEITGFGDVLGGTYDANSIAYNPVGVNYCAPVYKYGTRSNRFGLSVPEYGNSAFAATCETFNYSPGLFGISIDRYGIIKHNKFAQGVFYYIFDQADNPANPTTANHYFNIVDQEGNVVNASAIGLSIGDVVTVYWPNPNYNPKFAGDEAFLEDKFVRFAYRFLFDDGEYSVIAPFTQPVFIPKQKGYFEKRIGSVKTFPDDSNYFLNQEDEVGRTTVVDFFLNEVNEVNLQIPTEVPVNELGTRLKVKEIDILYKESTELALRVVKSIPINDPSIINNTTNTLPYIYQSEKPIKVLKSSEITRVFDNVPIRAAAQESSGNRIIYGNFYDRHTSPLTLDYLVNASKKFTLHNVQTTNSDIAYPNHTLKQRRTYQAGVILSDRYGRSSDVILSSFVGDQVDIIPAPNLEPLKFGSSTLYHPYKDSVIDPLTPSATFNTTTHVDAGIITWPGDSLKVLFANVIPNTINTADGYPGLYYNNITIAQGITSNPAVSGASVAIPVDPAVGIPTDIRPGMRLEWTSPDGTVYNSIITGIGEFAGDIIIYIEDNNPIWTVGGPIIGSFYNILEQTTLGWYSYKIVVKQQEQEYYNVYLPSLLNGNPVVKPFTLALAANPTVGSTRLEVDSTMADPRTFLLLEGMNFSASGQEYTITNILNDNQFDITPGLVAAIGPAFPALFTTKSTKNSINVTTLLTDNANKVPPGLIETTPVQQQYSTSKTRLIPRVAVSPDYVSLSASSPNVNGPIFPGKESAKVTALGNFANLFVGGKYDGLWQADTDPPSAIIQNRFQIGVFAQDAKPDSSASAVDQLQFSCYETSPVKSELEIFYETSTSGLVEELNESILNGTSIPVKIIPYTTPAPTYDALGTVEWNEELSATDPLSDPIQKFQFVDAANNPLLPVSAPSGTISDLTYVSEAYANGENSQIFWQNTSLDFLYNTYELKLSPDPAEALLGVYYLSLFDVGFGAIADAGGQYFREDISYNNINISLSINVEIFGAGTGYFVNYPFTISTGITNTPPIDSTSPDWNPVYMSALDTPGVSYNVNNNSGVAETGGDPAATDPSFPTPAGTTTKTFNGCYTLRRNRNSFEPNAVALAGALELEYNLLVEVDGSNVPTSGTGIYSKAIDVPLLEGLSLSEDVALFPDNAQPVIVAVTNVQYNGGALLTPISLAIEATDCNGSLEGESTIVSRFELDIQY